MSRKIWRIGVVLLGMSLVACQANKESNEKSTTAKPKVVDVTAATPGTEGLGYPKLSDYGFFKGNLHDLQPIAGIVPYQLNTPLFTDYAFKKRFIKLPKGEPAEYNDREVLDFPVGTVIIKNFYYPADFRKPKQDWQIMETRLLIHEAKGWKTLPYIWNNQQTEAYLKITGMTKQVSWIDRKGNRQIDNYSIPNMNQCRSCHVRDDKIQPIGPTARQLNGPLDYGNGDVHNQLVYLHKHGLLKGMPAIENVAKLAVWNDPSTGTLDQRARAYLEINCGHCHRPEGPAKTSGLHLMSYAEKPLELGIGKAPVAAGRAGKFQYDIDPGHPESSILVYRMESDDPGIMMPEMGRKMVHKEGVALIKAWIRQMNP